MIGLRWTIILGVAAFAWTLIAHAPAATLYGWLAPRNAPVQLLGLEGTLAEGRVAGVVDGGRSVVRGLHWRLRPLSLLLMRVGFKVDSSDPIALDGHVSVSPFGTRITSTHVSGGLKALLGAAGFGYLPIDGLADGTVDHLTLKHGVPTSATATLNLQGLAWVLAKPPLQLGDFRADIADDGDAVVAKLQSVGGPFDASGEARLLEDGSYVSDIRIKAKPGTPPMAQNLLGSLGQPDLQGYYHVKANGQLAGSAPAAAPANKSALHQ